MNLNLNNKNALVGGSSKGIGKACAIELATLGANVTLMARSEDKLREVLQGLPRKDEQHHDYMVVDFSNATGLQSEVKAFMAMQKKTYHILINNTGGPPGGPITKADVSEFLQAYNNHLVCNQLLAQTLLNGMIESGYGRIINVISTSVKQPISGLGVSNTTRWAVAGWAKTWANEVGVYGITVNNVLPGFTATDRLYSIINNRAAKSQASPKALEEAMKNSVPAKRFGHASEIANAVAFLATPAASYINGINLPVDGGRTMSL